MTDPSPDAAVIDKASEPLSERHLTLTQREDISASLQDSAVGPVSMTATASDKEAVCYQGEIASALEDSGFNVEIDNAPGKSPEEKISPGVGATIADNTFRPSHAYRIVHAFRRAGVAIATRISAKRRKKNTLYIAVGPNDALAGNAPTIGRLLAKWKTKVAAGVQRLKRRKTTSLDLEPRVPLPDDRLSYRVRVCAC